MKNRTATLVALAALAHVPGVTLEIAGDGDERRALEDLAGSLGIRSRVTFTGFVADPRPAIARAHALLSSARAEGLGIALLEAIDNDDPTALVGLPLIRTCRMLRAAGLRVF